MAAVKLKSGGDSPSSQHEENSKSIHTKVYSFTVVDISIVVLSMITFVLDLSTDAPDVGLRNIQRLEMNTDDYKFPNILPTLLYPVCFLNVTFFADIILIVNYLNHGHTYWALSTMLLVLLPAAVVQMFSMRWHIADESADPYHWITHFLLIGILHRYTVVMKTGLEARSSGDEIDFQRLFHQQSDICMLHLFESFMESAPQLVLQLYIMISLEGWYSWTALSAAVSLGSLAWAVAAYTRAMRKARPDKNCVSWPGLVLQATWRGGMLAARIAALVIFALGFHSWVFLLLGVHWLGMTIWVIYQKTDFCPTWWEERIYNCVVGVIYCFCFFNLQEGKSRNRALTFYTITVTENLACLAAFIALAGSTRPGLVQIAAITIVGGTLLGLCSMLLYYRFCHPAGPIKLWTASTKCDVEHALPPMEADKFATLRSLKHHCPRDKDDSLTKSEGLASHEGSPHSEVCTDKKFLLTGWASCQPVAFGPNETDGSFDELEGGETELADASVDLTACEGINLSGESLRLKRRGICSPAEIVQKLEEDKQEKIVEMNQGSGQNAKAKRRAICLEPDLEVELELSLEREKTPSPQKTTECREELRKLKRRGICPNDSSDNILDDVAKVNTSKDEEKSAENPALEKFPQSSETDSSDDKSNANVEQSDDSPSEILSAPSEVLSMHDYENICAVNIARETWGLRSWQGYSDIETWLHDDSVVRDRRRDTLSTVTSASSERSGSPPPLPCRRPAPPVRSRQDDYLDTLVDDLADCLAEPDFDNSTNVFVARPYVADQHGVFFLLDTIEEEAEETSSDNLNLRTGSASTLVATIDEIRSRGSICNIYNSQEDVWPLEEAETEDDDRVSAQANILLSSAHSRSHLTPEEVLFLSQLQAAPDTEVKPRKPSLQPAALADVTEPRGIESESSAHSLNVPDCKPEFLGDAIICEGDKKRTKPRRKVSLLREKFEIARKDKSFSLSPSDSLLTAVYSEPAIHGSTVNILEHVQQESHPIVPYNKENVTPAVTSRISQWNSISIKPHGGVSKLELSKVISPPTNELNKVVKGKPNFVNLRERRSTFLKQVLSPPKFQQWVKKGSLSPKTKIVPAS